MSELIRVHVTTGTEDEARSIAGTLLTERLAACVQVAGPVQSYYWWEGEIKHSDEWVCTAKTTAARFAAVCQTVQRVHSYDEPQIVATPVVQVSDGYRKWVVESVDTVS